MAGPLKTAQVASRPDDSDGEIEQILSGLRVPGLPYTASGGAPSATPDWRPLLAACWQEQRDDRVTGILRSADHEWSLRQVNAAYIADRIMDVFLKTSGLHPELVRRLARLRFYLSWRLERDGNTAFDPELVQWLDGLQEWRGWNPSGGRSSRILLEQLNDLQEAVASAFREGESTLLLEFCRAWQTASTKRQAHADRLYERLLETEKGAAHQRRADRLARALTGRALEGRHLPAEIVCFVLGPWLRLLRRAAAAASDDRFRHARRLLEWMVWVGDPCLSGSESAGRDRLYQVGEQLVDRIHEIWNQVFGHPLPGTETQGIERVLVARLRGEELPLTEAFASPPPFTWKKEWLEPGAPDPDTLASVCGRWFVSGEGQAEERRYFFAYLHDSAEILWTTGTGVKLDIQPWQEFRQWLDQGTIRPLPPLTPFHQVLTDTTRILAGVCEKQRQQRRKAAAQARARAEAMRREREAEEQKRRQQEAARQAELERQRREAEAERLAAVCAEQDRQARAQRLEVERQVARLQPGDWILLQDDTLAQSLRLKLAVRLHASGKLVFVDRMGLNRREFQETALVQAVVAHQVRLLDGSAEFDEALTRVVGRIRMGRNSNG